MEGKKATSEELLGDQAAQECSTQLLFLEMPTNGHILGGHRCLEYTFQPEQAEQSFRKYSDISSWAHSPGHREVNSLCWRLSWCRLGSLRFRSAGKIQSCNLVSVQRLFLPEGQVFHSSAEMLELNICKQEQNRLHKDQYIKAGLHFLLREHLLFRLSLHLLEGCAVIFALILLHRSKSSWAQKLNDLLHWRSKSRTDDWTTSEETEAGEY